MMVVTEKQLIDYCAQKCLVPAHLSRNETAEVGVHILHECHVKQREAGLYSCQDVRMTSQGVVPSFRLPPKQFTTMGKFMETLRRNGANLDPCQFIQTPAESWMPQKIIK